MKGMMTLAQAAQWIGQSRLLGDPDIRPIRVHTDTRTIEPGDLFFALKGEHHDANDFLEDALKRGAVAVVCIAGLPESKYPADLPRIEVADTRLALQQLATCWRKTFAVPVIAIAGSNGKTTVTQMVASILNVFSPEGAALATLGNFNNDIGVPLTILRMRELHRIAVVELGMNHPGEIAALAAIAQPTVALVNNAQREHLEFMHSVEAVAQENGSVLRALPGDGTAVFPADDTYTPLWHSIARPRKCISFAMQASENHERLTCIEATWVQGAWQIQASGLGAKLNYRLAVAGRHNVKNSLAAAACAIAAGVPATDIENGLSAFVPVKGRSKAIALNASGQQVTLIDDTYNANPDSVKAAIEVLADLPAPRLLVLGDMGEVGEKGPQFHAEAGSYAQTMGVTTLFSTGELAKSASQSFQGARHFASMEALCASTIAMLPAVNSVLVKGSRFMRMERVVDSVVTHFKNGGH